MSKKSTYKLCKKVSTTLFILGCSLSFTACSDNSQLSTTLQPITTLQPNETEKQVSKLEEGSGIITSIKIGERSFTATLYDNPSAQAFIEQLPITLDMKEMNGNEKYYFMDESLPTDFKQPEEIKNGDIMLYGSDCLVLFYKSFETSYSYTPLGHVTDPVGLMEALGKGEVQVTFSLYP